ncbi:MAG: transposase [Paracoccus sp. (in: a-proteobacteria)]
MNEITDKQHALIHPYLPVQRGNVRISNLTVISAILFVAENDCRWRALPPRFGKWHTNSTRMRRWPRPKPDRLVKWDYDRTIYKRRNEVKRLFRWPKGYWRIFSRFEKLDVMHRAFPNLALIVDIGYG